MSYHALVLFSLGLNWHLLFIKEFIFPACYLMKISSVLCVDSVRGGGYSQKKEVRTVQTGPDGLFTGDATGELRVWKWSTEPTAST